MNNRYIKRYSLPERQYIKGSPAVLAAGVLLEDTKKKRLVVQLKWRSISEKTIAKLAVYVKALDENGAELCKVKYTHRPGHARRGNIFGRYDAIELPVSEAKSIAIELIGVVTTDAQVWRNNSNDWITLPKFSALNLDGEHYSFFYKHITSGKYEYKQAADIWYCTCGAVNTSGEHRCHKCGLNHDRVAKYADPVSLAAELKAKKDADQKRQEDIEKFKAETGAKLTAFKEAAEKKASEAKGAIEKRAEEKARVKAEAEARVMAEAGIAERDAKMAALEAELAALKKEFGVETEEPAYSVGTEVEAEPKIHYVHPPVAAAPKKKSKAKFIFIAIVTVILIAAIVVVLPNMIGGGNTPGRINVNVVTAYDGDEVQLVFEEDANGLIEVTDNYIESMFPGTEVFVMDGTTYLGDDIDAYIKTSHYMAELIGSEGKHAYGYNSFNLNPEWDNGIFYIFAFDEDHELGAYGVGYFEDLGDDEWGFNMKKCDYDIEKLYREEQRKFRDVVEDIPEYGPDMLNSGDVAYFIRAFNYGTNAEEYNNVQKYYLYNSYEASSDYLVPVERLEDYLPDDSSEPVWTYFLLIDENEEIIGFSCYTTYDSSTAGTWSIETAYDTEMIEYIVPIENDAMKFELDAIKEAVPWREDIYTLELLSVPPVQAEIEDYISLSSYAMNYVFNGGNFGNSRQESAMMHLNSQAYALLLFSDDGRLVGYSIGEPDRGASREMPILLTLCDYNLTSVLEEIIIAYTAEYEEAGYTGFLGYVPYFYYDTELPLLIESGEVTRMLPGLNIGSDDREYVFNVNQFSLWKESRFPGYLEYRSAEIRYIEDYNTTDSQMYFLLLDDNYNIVGYTLKQD